jgi:hypothetical protein
MLKTRAWVSDEKLFWACILHDIGAIGWRHVLGLSQEFHRHLGICVWGLFLIGLGHAPGIRADAESIQLSYSAAGSWTLEVKGASLAEVLKVLSEKMKVPIVSARPPDAPMTLRCSGQDVRAILSCLLGSGASVMYRRGLLGNPDSIASVRILASSFFIGAPTRDARADPHQVALILEMVRAEDPEARADGYTRLAQLGAGNEMIQRSAFHQGLSDASGEVRAAALLGLHGVDPQGSREEMMNGLKDADGNVRLAALDIMGTGPEAESMLKQALSDSDELVRELARMRLGLPEKDTQ